MGNSSSHSHDNLPDLPLSVQREKLQDILLSSIENIQEGRLSSEALSPNIRIPQPVAEQSMKTMLVNSIGSRRNSSPDWSKSSIETPLKPSLSGWGINIKGTDESQLLPKYSISKSSIISPSIGSSLPVLSAPPKDSQLKKSNPPLKVSTHQGPPPPEKILSPKSPIDPKLYAPLPDNVSIPEAPIISRVKFTLKKEPAPPHRPLEKYNSCSTLFVTSTLSNANLEEVLQCVSIYILSLIDLQEMEVPDDHQIVDEQLFPFTKPPFYKMPMTETTIQLFLYKVFNLNELPVECAVISLVYLNRLLDKGKLKLNIMSWARTLLQALMTSSKIWEDNSVWNVDFQSVFPDLELLDMIRLEYWFLRTLRFDVSVKPSEYAKIYFELRQLAEPFLKRTIERPLSIQDATRLDVRLTDRSESSKFFTEENSESESEVDRRGSVTMKKARSDVIFHPQQTPATLL